MNVAFEQHEESTDWNPIQGNSSDPLAFYIARKKYKIFVTAMGHVFYIFSRYLGIYWWLNFMENKITNTHHTHIVLTGDLNFPREIVTWTQTQVASFWCQPSVVQTIENFNSKSCWSSQIVNGEYSGQFCLFMPQPENLGISYFCPVFHRILWTNMALWVLRGFTCKCTHLNDIWCDIMHFKPKKNQKIVKIRHFCNFLSVFVLIFALFFSFGEK